MTVSNVNTNTTTSSSSSSNASTAAAAATASVAALSVNDFLTLMTAQLQNQDPTQPLDPSTFVSQLAQFGTVSGIQSMQSSMSSLSSTLLSNQVMSGVGMVGHSVLAQAGSATYTSGQSLTGAVSVPSNATAVVLQITDSSGAVVRNLSVNPTAGMSSWTWDGTEANGTAAPSGTYNVQAVAEVGGSTEAATTYLNGTVSSVSLGSSGSGVTLNTSQLGNVALSSVEQID